MPYTVDYNDDRFKQVEQQKQEAMTQVDQTYNGMIEQTDKQFQDQINAVKDWGAKQQEIQQEQTDFAIQQVEQQKEQAQKDYTKEQQGAYVDWQKQSNQYGANAEAEAMQGMSRTGFSESSQVAMYTAYQNRLASARESFTKASLNYDNAITDARLKNSSVLADIAFDTLRQQLELSLEGFQYKNQLVLTQADKKTETDALFYQRYQDVLAQINQENALAEEIRQFNILHPQKTGGGGNPNPNPNPNDDLVLEDDEETESTPMTAELASLINNYDASRTTNAPGQGVVSSDTQKTINMLESMRGMTSSKKGIADSITVLAANGDISMNEAEYMYKHFGYDPNDYLE